MMAEVSQSKVEDHMNTYSNTLQNILDSTQQLMNNFDPTKYVSTYAERFALKTLTRFGSVFIKGRSGTGKTRVGLTLLSHIAREKKHTPIVLCFPQDWKLIPTTKEKYVVMIDNIFGSSNLSLSQVEKWERLFEIIWPSVESGNILLVLTSRPEISAQCMKRLKKYALMDKISNITLDEGELSLKSSEKIKFLRKYCGKRIHLSDEQIGKISEIHTSLGFPQCCEFFASSKHAQAMGENFFEKPHQCLKEVILTIMESDRLAYFVLQFIMLNQGILRYDVLRNLEPSSEFTKLIGELLNISHIPSKPTRGQIKEKAEALCSVYLYHGDKAYQFQHQSIFDAVFLDLAEEYPDICIRNCSAQMLVELVRIEGQPIEEHEVMLYLTKDMHGLLADRIAELLQSPNATDIWDHPSLRNEPFLQLLMSRLNCFNMRDVMSKSLVSMPEFSRAKDLIDSQDILLYAIMKKNEALTKLLVSKLETTRQEYNRRNVLALAIFKSLPDLVEMLLDKGITPDKKCIQALCLSESFDEAVVKMILAMLDIQKYTIKRERAIYLLVQESRNKTPLETLGIHESEITREESIRLFVHASLNGNITVAKLMMDLVVGKDKDFAYDCLALLFDKMAAIDIQVHKMHAIESAIKLLLLYDIDEYELESLISSCCAHHHSLALKTILERGVVYYPSNVMMYLTNALRYGACECVKELLKWVVKDDVVDGIGDFLEFAAGSHIDSGPKMKLLMENFDNAISVVNETFETMMTPLHVAFKRGNTEVVEILIKKGVNINIQDWKGETPLLLAVTGRHTDLVKNLLDSGADVNIVDYGASDTALQLADDVHIIKMLVQAGSDVNVVNKRGRTPLFSVVEHNDLSAVKFFYNKDSDVTSTDREGCSVLHLACSFGDLDMIKFLHESGARPTLDDNGASLLHYGVVSKSDAIEITQYVVGVLGVPVDGEDKCGRTPLFIAVKMRDMEVVEYLVEKEANLKHKDRDGNSLLHALCESMSRFHFGIMKYLCDAEVDPDLCNKSNRTALHVALSHSDTSLVPCITYLIERVSLINHADSNGRTPLHLAVRNVMYLELLLAKGAHSNINRTDNNGQTALHLAAEAGFVICMQLLLENGADKCINQADKFGQTPLHVACTVRDGFGWSSMLMQGNQHHVGILLEKDVVINQTDSNGQSPLHLAVRSNNVQSVKLLLEKGADRNIRDKFGKTPADFASTSHMKKLMEC